MDLQWSDRVEQVNWIAARQPSRAWVCTIPAGFAAYARLLHPIGSADPGGESADQVRWAQIARWSGVALGTRTQFWQLALPERLPAAAMPGSGAPASDVLGAADANTLAALLRVRTTTPDQCWFGIWDGYGWEGPNAAFTRIDEPVELPVQLSDPVPEAVRAGPRARLPGRDYLLYEGPVEAGLAFWPEQREVADLWWPEDRAWFVYGDVDLNSTYVAGSTELIEELLASPELEAVAADPSEPVVTGWGEVPSWLTDLVEGAVSGLLAARRSELVTPRFTARFELARRGPWRRWTLSYRCDGLTQTSGGTSLDGADLAGQLRRTVTSILIDQVEG